LFFSSLLSLTSLMVLLFLCFTPLCILTKTEWARLALQRGPQWNPWYCSFAYSFFGYFVTYLVLFFSSLFPLKIFVTSLM
jgi:hypothetical protein